MLMIMCINFFGLICNKLDLDLKYLFIFWHFMSEIKYSIAARIIECYAPSYKFLKRMIAGWLPDFAWVCVINNKKLSSHPSFEPDKNCWLLRPESVLRGPVCYYIIRVFVTTYYISDIIIESHVDLVNISSFFPLI